MRMAIRIALAILAVVSGLLLADLVLRLAGVHGWTESGSILWTVLYLPVVGIAWLLGIAIMIGVLGVAENRGLTGWLGDKVDPPPEPEDNQDDDPERDLQRDSLSYQVIVGWSRLHEGSATAAIRAWGSSVLQVRGELRRHGCDQLPRVSLVQRRLGQPVYWTPDLDLLIFVV